MPLLSPTRLALFSACAFATACSAPTSVETDTPQSDCFICEDTERLAGLISTGSADATVRDIIAAYVQEAKARPEFAAPMTFTMSVDDFCTDSKAQDLLSAARSYPSQLDSVAAALQACPDTCSVAINDAEYCAFGDSLTRQTNDWPVLSEAFLDTAVFLELAGQSGQPVITQLGQMLDGASGEALRAVEANLEALLTNVPANRDAATAPAAISDFEDAANVLDAMIWAGQIDARATDLKSKLNRIVSELTELPDEIDLALTRAAVFQPGDRLALSERLIDLYTNIAFVRATLAESPAGPPTEPVTASNAINPLAENPVSVQAAAACFTRLGMEGSVSSELSKIVRDELDACRSFSSCPGSSEMSANGRTGSIANRIVADLDKDQKLAFAVGQSLCQ